MIKDLRNSSALQVFLATVLAYAFAFFYEAGYLSFYGIGANYVQIKPLQILVGVVVAGLTIFCYDILFGVFDPANRSTAPRYTNLVVFCMFVLAVVTAAIASRMGHTTKWAVLSWAISLGVAALLLVIIFLDAIVSRFRGVSWPDALENHYQNVKINREKTKPQDSAESGLVISLSLIPDLLVPLILVGIIFGACFWVGRATTGYQDYYVTILKPTGTTDQIVVRDYGDQLLLKPFDTETQRLVPGFSIASSVGQTYEPALLKCSKTLINNSKTVANDRGTAVNCPKNKS